MRPTLETHHILLLMFVVGCVFVIANMMNKARLARINRR
jgi:hypothetical protein